MRTALRTAILLASCVATATSVAAPLRPPGAPGGATVAEVHLRVGTGSLLRAGGRDYPAAPGTALLADDELVVPAGQVLVVQLRNGYLVRLDDDVTLLVSQIVLINAPHTKESLGSQLDRLLTKEEQGRAERIAGVHGQVGGAIPSGIEGSVGAVTGTNRGDGAGAGFGRSTRLSPGAQANNKNDGSSATDRGPQRQTKAATTAPPPPVQPPPSKDIGRATAVIQAPSTPPARDEPPKATEAEKREPPPPPPPLPKESALRSCLARELGKLPVHVDTARVRLFLTAGKVTRASLGGGLRLPSCATKLLVGAKFEGADGWLDRELQLR